MGKPSGLTVEIGADTSKFNSAIKKMNTEIKNTNQQVYYLSKDLDLKWDPAKFLKAQQLAQQSLETTEQKAQALRDRLQWLDETGADNTSSHYKKVQEELTKAEYEAERFRQELQRLKDLKIEELAQKFKDIGSGIEEAGNKMKVVSAAAAAVLAGFSAITLSAVKAGDEIGTTAQQLNISTKDFQKWSYIAAQTDVPMAQMEMGLRKIQQGLGNLSAGQVDPVSDALKALGFTAEDAASGMEGNFENIIKSLANVKDSTMQAYYANEIFGTRVGAMLIPMLNDGGEGLDQLAAEFENLGYLSDDTVQKFDSFEDVMDKLKYQFDLIKNQIGAALLPLFQQLADFAQDKLLPAFSAFKDIMEGLSVQQLDTIATILGVVAALAPVLLIAGKVTSGIGGLIKSVGSLGKALTFLAAHPIILIIGVVVALLAALYAKNENFRNSVNELFKTLSNTLMPIIQVIMNLFKQLYKAFEPIITVLLNVLAPVFTYIIKIITFLVNILATVLVPYIKFVGKVWEEVFGFIGKLIGGVVDGVNWMVNKVIDFINKIIDAVNVVGDVLGFQIAKLDNVQIGVTMDENNIGSLQVTTKEPSGTTATTEEIPQLSAQTAETVINDVSYEYDNSVTNISNDDNSTKNFEVNVTIENYAENVDVDDLIRQINLKMAEAM